MRPPYHHDRRQIVANFRRPRASGPLAVGQQFTWTAHFLGKRLEAIHEVTDFEPNTQYALRSSHGGHHFQFEQQNHGTRLTVDVAARELGFLARVAEPLILRTARRHEQHSLETLKDLLETHGRTTRAEGCRCSMGSRVLGAWSWETSARDYQCGSRTGGR